MKFSMGIYESDGKTLGEFKGLSGAQQLEKYLKNWGNVLDSSEKYQIKKYIGILVQKRK